MTVISLSKLNGADISDDGMFVLECLEKTHAKVAANHHKSWYYYKDWDHIFAEVMRKGHGDYEIHIKDWSKFKKVCLMPSRDGKDELLEIGKYAIHLIREKEQKDHHAKEHKSH